MNIDLAKQLVCPACKQQLELHTTVSDGDDIVQGDLACGPCGALYLIEESIADLLPQNMENRQAA